MDEVRQADSRDNVSLLAEEVDVSKRVVPKSRVRVSVVTRDRQQVVDELLVHEQIEIERTPIDKPIDAMPAVREEQDSIVIPVVEEVLKIERQLILKEEVRIRRIRRTERYQEQVTLRAQEAVVNRSAIEEPSPAGTDTAQRPESDAKENP